MSVCIYVVCLSSCLSIYLSVHLSVILSICLSFVYPSICLSVSIYRSICLCISLSASELRGTTRTGYGVGSEGTASGRAQGGDSNRLRVGSEGTASERTLRSSGGNSARLQQLQVLALEATPPSMSTLKLTLTLQTISMRRNHRVHTGTHREQETLLMLRAI